MASNTTTFSIRLDATILERIDSAAERAGETRSTYILSWVPEYHAGHNEPEQRNTKTGSDQATTA